MKKTLYELFKMAQDGNDLAKMELYKKFLPCIRGFGRKLFYEEAETDLTIHLLEFIKKIDLEKFKNRKDGEIVNYMQASFKSKYINMLKQIINKNIETTILETEFMCFDCYKRLEEEQFFRLLKDLNQIQKKIIIGKYVYDYTDDELAVICETSRQTISKQKKKAITILKNKLISEEDSIYGRKVV